MESVHASPTRRSSTLPSTRREINESFRWSNENEALQKKAEIVKSYYDGNDPRSARSPPRDAGVLPLYSAYAPM